jgi:hypothetical protein
MCRNLECTENVRGPEPVTSGSALSVGSEQCRMIEAIIDTGTDTTAVESYQEEPRQIENLRPVFGIPPSWLVGD